MQNNEQPGKTGSWADGLEKSGQMTLNGNRVKMAADGSVSLSRAWTVEELAAFERIEKLHKESLAAIDRMESAKTKPLRVHCERCGREWSSAETAHADGIYCPRCPAHKDDHASLSVIFDA